MARIELQTLIRAPMERVFDLARSIDLHLASTAGTGEKAVGGVMSGLIGDDQEVTWRARHFGIWQHLTSRITAYQRPFHFRDTMVRGAFARFEHDHYFASANGVTEMRDVCVFAAPGWIAGRIVERFVLVAYLRRFLEERNAIIKATAESEDWRRYCPASGK